MHAVEQGFHRNIFRFLRATLRPAPFSLRTRTLGVHNKRKGSESMYASNTLSSSAVCQGRIDQLGPFLTGWGESRASVLRIPKYYAPAEAEQLASRLVSHPRRNQYGLAPSVGKVGSPYYDAAANEESESHYWHEARQWIQAIRNAFLPGLSPVDRLRLDLDEHTSGGARLLRDRSGRPAFVGLSRVFERAEAEPHVDRLEWDAPIGRFRRVPIRQIAANVYLAVPEHGGELQIWNNKPTARDYEALRNPASYGLRKELLGAPDVEIRPAPGELILFDAQKIHAVAPSSGKSRVTVAMFLVQFDQDGPFYMYS